MDPLVHPNEKTYFTIALVFSILIYLLLLISCLGLIYGVMIGGFLLFSHGIFIGHIKGNGIKINERQFPDIHQMIQQIASQMGMKSAPEVYILQHGGVLNAFATKLFSRSFVVIYSDLLEVAYEQGKEAVAFVICHELAHIQKNHLKWRWVLYPSMGIPFLFQAYSRACEYTCDRLGAYYTPNGAAEGLAVLAAGKHLFKKVNLEAFIDQSKVENGFWVWLSEALSTHPNLPKRVLAVNQFRANLIK